MMVWVLPPYAWTSPHSTFFLQNTGRCSPQLCLLLIDVQINSGLFLLEGNLRMEEHYPVGYSSSRAKYLPKSGWLLTLYNIQKQSTLHFMLHLMGGAPGPDCFRMMVGIAAGGKISQKVNCNSLPVVAYDHSKGQQLHISVINLAYFMSITGLPSPPSLVTPQMYLENNLPWFRLYNEHIPMANNMLTPTPLLNVLLVAQLLKDHKQTSENHASTSHTSKVQSLECGYCTHEMAMQHCRLCSHTFCDNCSNTKRCPLCHKPI